MGLMDEIKQEHNGPTPKCPVHKLLGLMNPTDATDLRKAVDDQLIPATVISRVLSRKNLTLKPTAISRHRRKECGCGK